MTSTFTQYTEADAEAARPGSLPIVETDVEVSASKSGDDLVVWVNKGGIQIMRVRLNGAAKEMTALHLIGFSSFAPDFVFKIGDTQDGMLRLKRSLGFVD